MANNRVLVIDDTRVIRLSIKTIFEKYGVEVLELGNVEDLFQAVWKYHRVDLLFLDIELPGMDGLTALEKIRRDPVLSKVPVIMLTSNADPHNVKKAIHAGIVDYVRKPFTSETLLQRVRPLLQLPAAPPAELPAASALVRKKSEPAATLWYAKISLPADALLPESLALLLKPAAASLQPGGAATLVMPFLFTGTEQAATEAFRLHLEQQGLPPDSCQVSSTSPWS